METPFNIDPNGVYSITEISKILRFSNQTITRDIRVKKLTAYKLGNKSYRVMGSDLIKYVNLGYLGAKK